MIGRREALLRVRLCAAGRSKVAKQTEREDRGRATLLCFQVRAGKEATSPVVR